MNDKGFTLIEMMIVLMFIPMILSITLSLLNLMRHQIPENINQEDVFLLQMTQLLIRSNDLKFEDDKITLTYKMTQFEITQHENRLVKRPGYEILLMDVVSIENDTRCFYVRTVKREHCIEK